MKKIFAIIALAVMLMVPISAMAMSPVSESDLSTITGQAGVSINLDVTVNAFMNVVAWGDDDGIINNAMTNDNLSHAYNSVGFVGISSLNIVGLNIRMRNFSKIEGGELLANDTEWDNIADALAGNADNAMNAIVLNQAFVTHDQYSKALTIDVGTDLSNHSKTIVSIGIPTAVITVGELTGNVALFPGVTSASNNPNKTTNGVIGGPVISTGPAQELGTLAINNLVVMPWGGRVDISSETMNTPINGFIHGGYNVFATVGVNIGLRDVRIETISAGGISWGDPDGVLNLQSGDKTNFGIFDKAGYIGIGGKNMIQNLLLNGDVTIDVASIDVAGVNSLWGNGADLHTTFIGRLLGAGGAGNPVYDRITCSALYAMKQLLIDGRSEDLAYVHIGLNSLLVGIDTIFMPIVLGPSPDLYGQANLTHHTLGIVYVSGLAATLNGWVDILAH